MRVRALFTAAGLACALAGCGPTTGRGGQPDLSVVDDRDLWGVPPGSDLSMTMSGPCSDTSPCPMNQVCYMGACIPSGGSCTDDNQCENDTYCWCQGGGGGDAGACMGGVCVPYGDGPRGLYDPDCHGQSFSASDFKPPALHCKWTGQAGSNWVVMTPLIIDLDGDGTPEIVFSPMGGNYQQSLVAIKSSDCTEIFNKPVNLQGFSNIAAADLDGDKRPEIVGVDTNKIVHVYDNKGNLLASSPTPYSFSSGAQFDCSGPSIANVDGMGPPEIAVAGQVLRYVKGQNQLTVLWTKAVPGGTWGSLSALADLDGDGKMELIAGTKIFDAVTGADKTPAGMANLGQPGGYPAVADFNGDKKPDVVIVQSAQGQQKVSVFDFANNKFLFGPVGVNGGGWGGPPTVADFDGDKVPDFGLASESYYYVYALKCAGNNKPPDCKGPDQGVLWEKPNHDTSSGATGSSVFDFNGDGKAEVVYRDECWLRVYNGADGKVVFAASVTSGTALENPVVGDVDNDGHADIVVSSDDEQGQGYCPNAPDPDTNTPWTGLTSGVYVYRDPMNRWMPSRAIWNEHAYHITNVNDDTTVPTVEKDSWLGWNDYRQNVQGMAGMAAPQPDFTGGQATGIDSGQADCVSAWTLKANLCNRGTAPVNAGVPGTFYSTDPSKMPATVICTAKTSMTLMPGDCETVQCDWKMPPQTPVDVWFRANDDGSGKASQAECLSGNDVLYLPQIACMKIG